ncbi:MAG: hypothetical protein BZY88_19810 [SAR202 cluster bacterium Io17-Chloro-G9]|nr:MAG: hypothetical protein BZY88_19810 [SAR202 cluster bacterium Io17-Chloro-G9]
MAAMRYCPHCGTQLQAEAALCVNCGYDLRPSPAPAPPMAPASTREVQAAETDLRYRISLNRVLLMTILSYGLYLFYWFYLTWKQYRDHTDEAVFPVWHALTLMVPIYGLFRTHAHTRIFKELMTGRGLLTTLAPGWAVVAVLSSSAFDWNATRLSFGELTQATAVTISVLGILSIGLVAWLLMHIQGNLNTYWHHVSSGRLHDARLGIGEVIFAIIGVLLWLDTLATLLSESYRLGY